MHCSTFLLAVAALSASLAGAAPANPAQLAACKLETLAELQEGKSLSLPASCPPAYTSPNLKSGCYWTCPPYVTSGLLPLASAQTPPPNTDGQTLTCKYSEMANTYKQPCSYSISTGKNIDTDDLCARQLTKSC